MFKKGDFVIYETAGVCQVTDISTVDIKGIAPDRLFYFLEPLHSKGSRLYIPVENHKSRMRPLLSQQEAGELISSAGDLGDLSDCREWVKVINTLRHRKAERISRGKKLPSMDARYLKIAEECLYTELSLVLDLPEEKIQSLIQND